MPWATPDYSFENGVDNLEICEHSLADGRGRGRKSIISSFIIPRNRKRGSAREKPQFIDKMKRESVMAVSQAIKSRLKKGNVFSNVFSKKEIITTFEMHAESLASPTELFFSNCSLKGGFVFIIIPGSRLGVVLINNGPGHER